MFKISMMFALVSVLTAGFAMAQVRTGGSGLAKEVETDDAFVEATQDQDEEEVSFMRGTAGVGGIKDVKVSENVQPVAIQMLESAKSETYVEEEADEEGTEEDTGLDMIIQQEIMEEEKKEMPETGVGITESYPNNGLADTGAAQRNALYLLISLFGVVGLMMVMRKENA